MKRYVPVKEANGDFVVINTNGRLAFVYAIDNCKNCYGRGWIGHKAGCKECLGEGQKHGTECHKCKGTGRGEDGEKHLFPCPCLKHEFEEEDKEEEERNNG